MATQVGQIDVQVNQDAGSGGNVTCFGLPGSVANAVYCDVSTTISVRIFDDSSVQVAISGTITQNQILSSNYPVAFFVCPHDWSFGYSGSGLTYPSDCIQLASADVIVGGGGRGTFTWNINSGYHNVGHLTDYGASDTGDDGYLWASGTGTYGNLTDPIYPDPVRITVPGFMAYLDYYVGAIRKSGTMRSCNRGGGSSKIRKSGSWRDVKNVETGNGTNQGLYRHNGAWTKLPKIGASA